jgi:hypothetical protein
MTNTCTLSKAEMDQAIRDYVYKQGFCVEGEIQYWTGPIKATCEVKTKEKAEYDDQTDYFYSIGR